MVKVSIAGATGYTGFELIRILLQHSEVKLVSLTSETYSGQCISAVFPALRGWIQNELISLQSDLPSCDFFFLALPHTTAMERVPEFLERGIKVIDLSADFRLHDPKVFVLDEPMVGLDPHHQYVLKEVLKNCAKAGMTIFLSTHQLSVAEDVADRVGIIHMGKLVAVGTNEELQAMGGQGNTALEETFLALTQEESDVAVLRQLQQG